MRHVVSGRSTPFTRRSACPSFASNCALATTLLSATLLLYLSPQPRFPSRNLARAFGMASSLSSAAGRGSTAVSHFGSVAGQAVELFTLKRGEMEVQVSAWGATIIRVLLPRKVDNASGASSGVDDVVLGFDELAPYQDGRSPYFGSIVGRVANRIAQGKFELEGRKYQLPINNGPNSLHGGTVGFDKVLWKGEGGGSDSPSVRFTHLSPAGDQGYPGDLAVEVTYTLTSELELCTKMEARALSEVTPVNLAQHTYWNLGGHASGDVLQHRLKVWADHVTTVDSDLIPTGEKMPVSETPFDFTKETPIGNRIGEVSGGGFDHNYVLRGGELDEGEEERTSIRSSSGEEGLHRAARVVDPVSGHTMDLWTTAPGVQVYSGNFLDGTLKGKGGAVYQRHSALCLETQGFPNAVNEPSFPSVLLRPGETYRHVMLHRFGFVGPSSLETS
eukprot:TRINITY_DN17189_c0_g1_i1.p1 TRINITY_DN17189_c0_g1~~TRINITY_DN17189_c0_g1_i1.p1  ORF type:complete len:446 (-),score=54.14 TRINITY_DN17189_c0_g1_i1:527-1864(-)